LAQVKKVQRARDLLKSRGLLMAWTLPANERSRLARAKELVVITQMAAAREFVKSGKLTQAEGMERDNKRLLQQRDVLTADVPDDAVKFGRWYYKVFKDRLPWHEASAACARMGGALSIVRSKEENEFILGLAKASNLSELWLGASDEQEEGKWVWEDGTLLRYANWDKGQPNDAKFVPTGEDFLAMVVSREGVWWDIPNDAAVVGWHPGFVCQW
jgi:hypothetical protein